MFERFTQMARRCIVLAQEEARRLDHNYIGTEHILLGLIAERESIAGQVLADFGMTSEGIREEVVSSVGRGKKAPSGHIPFTPRAKKTLELSLREALKLGHNYIGTEHILLGLIREGDGIAAQILGRHGGLPAIRAAVITAAPATGASAEDPEAAGEDSNAMVRWMRRRLSRHAGDVPLAARGRIDPPRGTPAVEAALKQAAALADQLPVGSHHLLLAALADRNSAASWALASLGVDIDQLSEKLRTAQVEGTSDEQPEQAGRRQMAIEVSDETLRIVLTDPAIVEAGNEALRVLTAQAQSEGEPATPVTGSVIRGDHPAAGNLANVWLELRRTLATLAGDSYSEPDLRVKVAVKPPEDPDAEPGPGEEPGA
jgi:ATP-dependent Clp protease ATP-binding subunit ClpA